jgi:hypothetical protein
MSKAELDELNRVSKEWRERRNPGVGLPEPSQQDLEDSPTTQLAPFTAGDQLELLSTTAS